MYRSIITVIIRINVILFSLLSETETIWNVTDLVDVQCYSSRDFNLTVYSVKYHLNEAIRYRLSEIYFEVYPSLVKRFNSAAPRSINVYIDFKNEYPYWGSAIDSTIIINGRRLLDSKSSSPYFDIFLHELAHIAQQYTNKNYDDLKWLGEGLADYVRYTYSHLNIDSDWHLPDFSENQSFNDGYAITARFLVWLEINYNQTIIDQLDRQLRDVTYNTNLTWTHLTGKSIDQLWQDYRKRPLLLRSKLLNPVTKKIHNIE